MAQDGDYPFLVYVWNTFDKTINPDLTIDVTFNHWSYGKRPQLPPPEPDNTLTCTINPGDMICFPLFWGPIYDENDLVVDGENIVISVDFNNKTVPDPYYIYAGPKAVYTPDNSLTQYFDINCVTGGENSGIYKIQDNNPNQWTLRVDKLVVDPETTSVSIGPDIP